jgi:tetratricopeptide (TPR) repeat protein
MSQNEQTQQETALKMGPGVTLPNADQLHGRLLEDFKTSFQANPEGVYGRWGYTWLHSMSDEDAMAHREALGFPRVDALDHYNMGCHQAAKEDYAGAAKSFAKAYEMDADLSEALYNQAMAVEAAGKVADARQLWKSYLDKFGDASEEETRQIKDRLTALADA